MFDYLVAHGRMKEKEARVKFRQVSSNMDGVFSPLYKHRLLLVQYFCSKYGNTHFMYQVFMAYSGGCIT